MDVTTLELRQLTHTIITQAKKMGATAVEVMINTDSGFAINVRQNNVETIEHSHGKNVTAVVYFGYHSGAASTSDLKPEAITTMLDKACYIARFTEEDPCIGLAAQELMAYDYPDLELYHPWPLKITEAIELAKSCEAQALSHDHRITNSEGTEVSVASTLNIYANSHGFCGLVAATKHSISCALIATQAEEMQRDYYYTLARDAKCLETYQEVAIKAATRAVARLGTRKIATQKCPVIFSAEVAPSLINNFIQAISGTNLYRKSSFLVDHLHQPVFARHINIEEDPHLPKALGSSPFDAEGVKLAKSPIVKEGVLQRYVLDSYAARKLNMQTTGNAGGIHNLIVSVDPLDFSGLLKKMHTGLLVTEFMGGGVNIVTGDYSRGVFGYWVENGEIQYPVSGATIAGNLQPMFLNMQAVSNDIDYRGSILTGSILLEEMTIAGC